MTKLFKKSYFEAIFSLFYPNLGKNELFRKRAQSIFKYSSYVPSRKKSDNTNDPFLKKTPNRQFDRSLAVQTVWTFSNCWNFRNHFQFLTQGFLYFVSLSESGSEDVKTRFDLKLKLFSLNLTNNLSQQFGILKLVILRIHATRVISIFNLCY